MPTEREQISFAPHSFSDSCPWEKAGSYIDAYTALVRVPMALVWEYKKGFGAHEKLKKFIKNGRFVPDDERYTGEPFEAGQWEEDTILRYQYDYQIPRGTSFRVVSWGIVVDHFIDGPAILSSNGITIEDPYNYTIFSPSNLIGEVDHGRLKHRLLGSKNEFLLRYNWAEVYNKAE
ncbi:MAG TPA: hypothetical protein VLE91_04775 [Candidatus Saccharimonadales bacterium]|nr:hypothetical protein [Candidatus Saccharimonadales bacterium]